MADRVATVTSMPSPTQGRLQRCIQACPELLENYEVDPVVQGSGASGAIIFPVRRKLDKRRSKAGGGDDDHDNVAASDENPNPWLACKLFIFDSNGEASPGEAILRSESESEIRLLHQLHNPGLVDLLDCCEGPASRAIVMPMLQGGDLADLLSERGSFAEEDARAITSGVLTCLAHMHGKGVAHRDIKLENIMAVDENNPTDVRVVDLGMSKQLRGGPDKTATTKASHSAMVDLIKGGRRRRGRHTLCGTPIYMSPECFGSALEHRTSGNGCVTSEYGVEVDMWAMGVVLYMLLSGYPPFDPTKNSHDATFLNISKGKYDFNDPAWEMVGREAKDLVRRMLTVDPNKRITADEALVHPWMTK